MTLHGKTDHAWDNNPFVEAYGFTLATDLSKLEKTI
jgi:hypothetical protein